MLSHGSNATWALTPDKINSCWCLVLARNHCQLLQKDTVLACFILNCPTLWHSWKDFCSREWQIPILNTPVNWHFGIIEFFLKKNLSCSKNMFFAINKSQTQVIFEFSKCIAQMLKFLINQSQVCRWEEKVMKSMRA